METYARKCDSYETGYENDYGLVYDQGFVFYDEDDADGLNEESDDGDEVGDGCDVVLEFPGKTDEIGIA